MTPREYLSWSSLDLLERNVERWKKVYLQNEPMRINRGMAFGKQMAEGLENDEMTGDPVLDVIIDRLPKFEIMDEAFRAELKCGKKIVPILIKPDTIKKDFSAFKEYKTGQEPWTKAKVDNFGQITFYATGAYLITGRIPQDIELVHVQTAKEDNGSLDAKLTATGQIYRYPTKRSMQQVLGMMVRMKKAWELIEKITEEELF